MNHSGIHSSITKLYIQVYGSILNEKYLSQMSTQMFDDRFRMLDEFDERTKELRSSINEHLMSLDVDNIDDDYDKNRSLIIDDIKKLDKISKCLMKLFDKTYEQYSKKFNQSPDDYNGNNSYDQLQLTACENEVKVKHMLIQNFQIENNLEFHNLFVNEDYHNFEWKQWFDSSEEKCVALRLYCQTYFEDEISEHIRQLVKKMLNHNVDNTVNNQIEKKIIKRIYYVNKLLKSIQELWYIVEKIHDKIIFANDNDDDDDDENDPLNSEYYKCLLQQSMKMIILNYINYKDEQKLFHFKHFFSTKLRIMFFDYKYNGLHRGYDDRLRLRNSKLISILCRMQALPSEIFLICIKCLLTLKQDNHLQCLVEMFDYYGLDVFENLLTNIFTNNNNNNNIDDNDGQKQYVQSIFNDLNDLINESHDDVKNDDHNDIDESDHQSQSTVNVKEKLKQIHKSILRIIV